MTMIMPYTIYIDPISKLQRPKIKGVKHTKFAATQKKKSTDQILKQLEFLLKSQENDSFVTEMVKNDALRKEFS